MRAGFVYAIIFAFLLNTTTLAQSGRAKNPPPPPPKPTNQPPPPSTTKILNLPEGGKVAKYDTDGISSRFTLKNGLTVIIRERHAAPLAAVTTYVKAGHFNEPDEVVGLAKLTQQMLFKGTATRPVGTIAAETALLGGVIEAETSYEKTVYSVTAPTESLPKILEVQADMLQNPAFDAEELKKAALALMQESRSQQDNAAAFAQEKMFATAFTTHRLKRWRNGSDDTLKAITREQVQAFYQTFYRPENTVIVVVGDVIMNQVIPQIQQLYANFGTTPEPSATQSKLADAKPEAAKPQAKPAVATAKTPNTAKVPATTAKPAATTATAPAPAATDPKSSDPKAAEAKPADPQSATAATSSPISNFKSPMPEEPAQTMLRYSNERGDIGQTIVTIGYHAPALSNTADGLREQAAMEVLAATLGVGRGSRLNSALREKMGAVSGVSVEYLPLPTVGVFSVQLRVTPGGLDHGEGEYFRQIERFRRELLSEGELQRAKSLLEKRFYDATASMHAEAELLAHYQAQLGDFRLLNAQLARLRAVTAKDVQQIAAKILALGKTTVHEYEPRTAPPRTFTTEKFAETIAILAPTSMQQIKPEDVKPAVTLRQIAQGKERNPIADDDKVIVSAMPLPIKDFSIYRGPRAYVREDQSRPTLTIGVFFQGGRIIEDQSTSGSTELLLRSMLKSTMTRKGDLIALELENYGGDISLVNEPDFFGFTLDVLSRNAEKALAVLLEIIENPYFDKAEITREREALLARQLQQRDDGVQRPIELAMASVYPGHPYGLPRYGLPAVVKAATDESLEAWYKKTIRRQFPLVVLVGDTDGSALISSMFSEAFKRESNQLDQSLKVNLPALTVTPQEQIEARARKQTAQTIALRTPPLTQANPYVWTVLEHYASGLGGRFFRELRDQQSLAYSTMLRHQQGLANGTLLAYIATSPENEAKAQAALVKELENLSKTPPSNEEFERGRNAAIGSYAVALQSNPVRLLEYARAVMFGRKVTDVETQPDLIRAVKKEDLKAAAEAVIKMTSAGRGVVRGEQAASAK
ncbi:MAG TPA: pitrilysin family protein [Blastocatellia bacterium]|nr:pitrilysin family protein [Blastocatellia bacterium]